MVSQVLPYARIVDKSLNTCCLKLFSISDTRVQEDVRRSKYTTRYNHFLLGYDLLELALSVRSNFDPSELSAVGSDGNHSSHLGIKEYVYVLAGMSQKCSYPTATLRIGVDGTLRPACRRKSLLEYMTCNRNFPTYSNGWAVIPITVERKLFAQFLRGLNNSIIKRMIWIRRLCKKLPFRSVKRWVIVTYIATILATVREFLLLSMTENDTGIQTSR